MHTDNGSNIDALIEFLRLYITRYINPNYTAGFVAALDAGARTETGVKGWLAGGTGRGGDIKGVAACCCGADAAEAGDIPGPGRTARGRGCRGASSKDGEETEGSDFGEHFA